MARLRPLAKERTSPEVRAILERNEELYPGMVTSAGIQAHCPPILFASRALGRAPAESGTLTAQLRALVQLRAAQIVRCPF
jgi:hypothetical protein